MIVLVYFILSLFNCRYLCVVPGPMW